MFVILVFSDVVHTDKLTLQQDEGWEDWSGDSDDGDFDLAEAIGDLTKRCVMLTYY